MLSARFIELRVDVRWGRFLRLRKGPSLCRLLQSRTDEPELWYNILRYVLPSAMERKPQWATEVEEKC
jgi:hypothetical protein